MQLPIEAFSLNDVTAHTTHGKTHPYFAAEHLQQVLVLPSVFKCRARPF